MLRFLLALALSLLLLSDDASAQISIGSGRALTRTLATQTVPQQIAALDRLSHGSVDDLSVSGSTARYSEPLRVPDGAWITRIEVGERGDRPCSLRLQWTTVSNGNVYLGSEHFGCDNANEMRVGFFGTESGSVDETYYKALTGIRVCQRRSSGRIKGLQAGGSYLRNFAPTRVNLGDPTDTYGTWSGGASVGFEALGAERTNCNDWEARFESCPDSEVLIGLTAYFDSSNRSNVNRIEMKGLRPVCGRLDVHTD